MSSARAVSVIGLAALAGEVVLVAALALGVPALFVAPLHLATAVTAVVVSTRRGGDFAMPLLLGASVLALGPLGAMAAIVAARRADTLDPTLGEWHERIIDRRPVEPAEKLYRDIVEGRAYRALGVPQAFADVMSSGDVAQRQRLLGLLAKQDAPVPAGLIDAGLSAPELAVRAPAAAVVARLRERGREVRR